MNQFSPAEISEARLLNMLHQHLQDCTASQLRDVLLYVGVQLGDRSRESGRTPVERAAYNAANCAVRAARDTLDWLIAPLEPTQ